MKTTQTRTKLFLSGFTTLVVTALVGAGLAFANVARTSEPGTTPCVGIVSFDYGADGTFDASEEIPLASCGASTGTKVVR